MDCPRRGLSGLGGLTWPGRSSGEPSLHRIRCAAHKRLYAQIDEDLSAFPRGISKGLVDKALKKWPENGIFASLMVLNGSL